MASRRRTAEDKNTKLLRELAALPPNKQCFDCLQRGPTYINVTIGSFVCTTCSGILRGLTPPHRVKSISMTTFSTEEIEFLKNRGNDYCKYVWLGTYDSNLESEITDDLRKRDFMIQKYEKKRWYVDPDVAIKKMQSDQILRQKNVTTPPQNSSSRNALPETQPLSRLLGKSPTPLVVQSHVCIHSESWPHPVSSASAPAISTKTTSQNHGSRSIDLLSEFSGNAATSAQGGNPKSATANGNFANFENAFNLNTVEKSGLLHWPSFAVPPALPSSASLDAYPLSSQHNRMESTASVLSPPPTSKTSTIASQQASADRYAALADLDSLFHQPTTAKAPSWTVETTSSGSLFDVPETTSTFSTATSNPFTCNELWSQTPAAKALSSYQAANPFQGSMDNSTTYTQPTAGQPFAPFPIPIVGSSPSEDSARSQFSTSFANFPATVSSPTNGFGVGQILLQNGGFTSPPPGSGNSWGVPSSAQLWSSSQVTQGGLFSNDNKSMDVAQHTDWIQNPINPFLASHTQPSNLSYSSAPRSNSSNPFL
ncbi:arf-GAP domain and FG repeat-containing protein 1-like [Uloborus diversus]|uniref:arf-GAP domain and FG repeat-containing protein 1-like n=1 Tax=Uloborus diversus TaxID=327109 RepID=UPI0024093E7F|nr:arf-GAP domain and FG repeat-containing protein 1-like [Uloborus diversus]